MKPILFLILLIGLLNLKNTIRGPRQDYFAVDKSKRLGIGVLYFGLMIALVIGMWALDGPLERHRLLEQGGNELSQQSQLQQESRLPSVEYLVRC